MTKHYATWYCDIARLRQGDVIPGVLHGYASATRDEALAEMVRHVTELHGAAWVVIPQSVRRGEATRHVEPAR